MIAILQMTEVNSLKRTPDSQNLLVGEKEVCSLRISTHISVNVEHLGYSRILATFPLSVT